MGFLRMSLGFTKLKLSKLLMCETFCDKLKDCFGAQDTQLGYMKTHSFVKSVNRINLNDKQNLNNLCDFSNHEKKVMNFSVIKKDSEDLILILLKLYG